MSSGSIINIENRESLSHLLHQFIRMTDKNKHSSSKQHRHSKHKQKHLSNNDHYQMSTIYNQNYTYTYNDYDDEEDKVSYSQRIENA
jgi:hypothetical protein